MAALPHQENLTVPIAWGGETQKTEMVAAGYRPTVTLGWRPWSETATLEWRLLSAAEANSMLNGFRATNFNGVYDYQCSLRGAIRLKLDGAYMFTEEYDTKTVTVSVGVRRV
jgi:hypothetical protein